MAKYIYLPHTADAKFRAFGATLESAFKNAAYAMTDIMTDHTKIDPNMRRKISISSEDEKSLLYDFLEQLLVLLDTHGFLLREVKKITIYEKKKRLVLVAHVLGDKYTRRYDIKTTIKAVTYQEMEIKHEKGRVTLQVVVDI
jgi:SHS2 domain-containing protein